ncbi:hypothetical protein CDAR_221321 [Caerostris darwini]|uniref:Uncharacterized protein n=1 Tax=Caerostris darwini TaxID=1538125 RepID=A0AAV4WMB8_9ARAC|nr:hypothetical protein CDAR_221321 [Caerostris darwini]
MSILPEAVVPVNASMASSTRIGFEDHFGLIITLMILALTFGLSFLFCFCQYKVVPYCRRKFRTKRQGVKDHRSNSGGNHQAGADLPLPALRRVAPRTCPSNQLLQEDNCEPREETPDTRMEAKENIPNVNYRKLQLVPRLIRMIRNRRRGRRNRRVHFELPLPTRREVAASQCPLDQLPQEDRRVSRNETPHARMEAKENIPMPKIPMERDL